MAKKKINQLELLNAKFDKLIDVLLSQKSQVQTVETTVPPISKKYVTEYDVILKDETKSVQSKCTPKIVSFFVDPAAMITINGMPYEGSVVVDEGLATIIRRMLYDWERNRNNVLRERTHTRPVGLPMRVINGNM